MINGFKIEKDVPMPLNSGGQATNKFPFAQMEIGDSFFVPRTGKYQLITFINNVSGYARVWRQRNNRMDWKFTCRKDAGNDGVRVWRVA